ncbi:hypothetical protein QBC32DRAFT_119682 [Pseudoneurospora amorphoporcata]|uniref:Uncharacterized protein n=1 Tax=Pseudoneurospora amorphoporcata TaxID=241081 RepID=A0AAN6NWU1_9PEZI|nr:hypothetical protein QBC32DRAFT_119682 [Pseudoneurospora amorphoporcata]
MAIPHVVPALLGTVAVLATTAIFVIHIILARSLAQETSSPVRTTTIVAAVFEGLALLTTTFIFVSSYVVSCLVRRFNAVLFGAGLFVCSVAAALSIATLVLVSKDSAKLPTEVAGTKTSGFLVGGSVALGVASAAQLLFQVLQFINVRMGGGGFSGDEECPARQQQVKAIPYQQTNPNTEKVRFEDPTVAGRATPHPSYGHSVGNSLSSWRSSLYSVMRPIPSKTHLLAGNSQHSLPLRMCQSDWIDSTAMREHHTSSIATTLTGFDSWDTSSVEPSNRQTVAEAASACSPPMLPAPFLEAMPASPMASGQSWPRLPPTDSQPDLGNSLLIPPKAIRRRSRSFSPASMRSLEFAREAFTQHATHSETHISESHIHPLFRSDSPTPPAIVSPGTVVVAAPNGGQVLSDKHSIRTLARKRSESLPAVSSPLSRQGSLESFRTKVTRYEGGSRPGTTTEELREEDEEENNEEDEEDDERDQMMKGKWKTAAVSSPSTSPRSSLAHDDAADRAVTPPIPGWILVAGARTSLLGYNQRKNSGQTPTSAPADDEEEEDVAGASAR